LSNEPNKDKKTALSILELDDPSDLKEIKGQYRKLAMRHHPDRGGSKEKLQAINGAMKTLSAFY
jgi:curved DNA-binding protein CbpA